MTISLQPVDCAARDHGSGWRRGLRPRSAGRGRIRVQARLRPQPRLSDALHRRHPTRKPASRDTESHGKWFDLRPTKLISIYSGAFRAFPCPAGTAGFRVRRGEKARRGWGVGLAADGELVHQDAVNAAPQAVADGSSPSRLPWSRAAPTHRLVFFD